VTVVKYIPYRNRLAKLIRLPGGAPVREALAKAEANVEALRASSLAIIDDMLAEIDRLGAPRTSPDGRDSGQIYDVANQLVGIAGLFGLEAVGQAALSLCELVDCTSEVGCEREEMDVHIRSLHLLRRPEALGQVGQDAVLKGLVNVVRHAKARGAASRSPGAAAAPATQG
jgi:hypothetical protein